MLHTAARLTSVTQATTNCTCASTSSNSAPARTCLARPSPYRGTTCHSQLLRQPSRRRSVRRRAVVPPEKEEKGGPGLLERPPPDLAPDDSQVLPDTFYGSTESPPGSGLGGGDWRVMLLDSPTHTEALVVRVLTSVVSSVDEQQAKNCFSTSRQLGQALVVACLKEHAEFFTQMINRQGVRSIIEPDTTTL